MRLIWISNQLGIAALFAAYPLATAASNDVAIMLTPEPTSLDKDDEPLVNAT